MENAKTYLVPLGRLLMSSLFIWAGFGKLMNPGGTAQYFASYHLPAPDVLVWIVIIIELIGGLMILVGFQTRWVALVLAIFCLITAFGIHLPTGDMPNMIHFYKNLVMAGGFLYVFAHGAGALSVDNRTA
jgi:putative oxidoreductase